MRKKYNTKREANSPSLDHSVRSTTALPSRTYIGTQLRSSGTWQNWKSAFGSSPLASNATHPRCQRVQVAKLLKHSNAAKKEPSLIGIGSTRKKFKFRSKQEGIKNAKLLKWLWANPPGLFQTCTLSQLLDPTAAVRSLKFTTDVMVVYW